ncbi:unnamed protein product [Effrenium voratum]|nr:unnamed protein product [Effrenium voratum]
MEVPYRCLVPEDSVSFIIGKGGATIRQMCDQSGASVSISKPGEAPATLADKIVTLAGSQRAKDGACREVVRKLRQMQGVTDMEPGVFVIIIPQISVPVVIGTKGAQIKSIMEQSGAEINVGREAILGMPDQPISINGTVEQVVLAVSGINSVLQDMADRGKLHDRDFLFRAESNGGSDFLSRRPEPASERRPEPTFERKPEPTFERKPEPAFERKPEPAFEHRPEPAFERKPEPAFERKPEPAFERRPEPTFERRPEPSPPTASAHTAAALAPAPALNGHGVNGGYSQGNPAGGMGVMGAMGLGMGNMGNMGNMGSSEKAFFSALQASGINSAELTILLPKDLLHQVLVPRGIMSEVAQRSGSRIDVGEEAPPGMLQVTLHGQMVGNSMAAMLLQERVIQWHMR